MATEYIDGPMIDGSFETTINSLTYIANSCSLTMPSTTPTERNDTKGRLEAVAVYKDINRLTGTAELQVDTTAKAGDIQFEEFIIPADHNSYGDDLTVVITEITSDSSVGTSRTISVNIRIKITQPV